MRFISLLSGLAILLIATAAQAGVNTVPEVGPPSFDRAFRFEGSECNPQAFEPCIDGGSAVLGISDYALGEIVTDTSRITGFGFRSDSRAFNHFRMLEIFSADIQIFGEDNEQAEVSLAGFAVVLRPEIFFDDDDEESNEVFALQSGGRLVDTFIEFHFNSSAETGEWSMVGFFDEGRGVFDDLGGAHQWNVASEPGALALLGVGLIGLAAMRRRRQSFAA